MLLPQGGLSTYLLPFWFYVLQGIDMSSQSKQVMNHLFEALPPGVRNHLLKRFVIVEWKFGEIVCEANQDYEQVFFPVTGFISQIIVLGDNQPLEMGLIGNEGMLGANLVLGVNNIPLQSVVQGAGTAFSIPAEQFKLLLLDCPELASILMRYNYVLMEQLALGGACLHYHDIESRLARWLLMTQDRTLGETLYLTHAFLAYMLGVRRSSVSLAADAMQKNNLIHYSRGKISILDREGLEQASCTCYKTMIDAYKRIMK